MTTFPYPLGTAKSKLIMLVEQMENKQRKTWIKDRISFLSRFPRLTTSNGNYDLEIVWCF